VPSVTVVMPVLNGEATIREALESVLSQSMTDFEVLVLDNGSTDRTTNIVESMDDSRVHLLTHTRAMTFDDCQNEGVRLARSEYIARLDVDDRCQADRLQLQLAAFQGDPDVGVVVGGARFISDAGLCFAYREPPRSHAGVWLRLLTGNCIVHSSSMVRRSSLFAAGGYRSGYRYSEDYDLWLRLISCTKFATIRQPIVDYRVHSGAVSLQHTCEQRESAEKARCEAVSQLLGAGGVPPTDISGVEMQDREDFRAFVTFVDRCRAAVRQHCRLMGIPTSGIDEVWANLVWRKRFGADLAVLCLRRPALVRGLVVNKAKRRSRRLLAEANR
jgi:glycosyltransferase involved in cell wall biosynthesis